MRFSLPSIKYSATPPSFRLGCLNCTQRFDLISARSAVVGSWEEPPNIWLTAAKNAFGRCDLNYRVRMLLKSAVTCNGVNLSLTDLCFTLNFNSAQQLSALAILDHTSPLSGLPFLNWKGSSYSTSLYSITSWSSLHSIATLRQSKMIRHKYEHFSYSGIRDT